MIARLKLIWRALTWPIDRFHGLVELTYAGEFDEDTGRFIDSGEVTTRMEGMVLISYMVEETALYCRRPFYDLKDEPSYYGLSHVIDD